MIKCNVMEWTCAHNSIQIKMKVKFIFFVFMSLFSSHSNRNEFMCTFNVVYFTCIENKDSASIFHVLFTSVFFKSDSCSRSTEFSFAYASPAYQFICEKNRNESD